VRSAIYEGTVRHDRRDTPAGSFTRPVALPYLDLEEVGDVVAMHPLWSQERPNLISVRRRDFLPDEPGPLDAAVRGLLARGTGRVVAGPVVLLGQVRTLGWLFNPVSLYFALDDAGHLDAVAAEVTNTPWHERQVYVIDPSRPGDLIDKTLHVSPFQPMARAYRFTFSEPGERLHVRIQSVTGDAVTFAASMDLRRRELTRRELGRYAVRHALQTVGVSAGIYRRAAALRVRRASVYPHPRPA